MTYFQDTTLTDIPDAINFLRDQCLAEGWTVTELNTSVADVTTVRRVGREFIAEIPGDTPGSGNAALGHICVSFLHAFSSGRHINLCGWTGQKVATIASSSRSGTTLSVTTSSPHGFATGDLVIVNGQSDADLNQPIGGAAASPNTITVTGGSTFDVTIPVGAGGPATGGTVVAVYNFTGTRTGDQTEQNRMALMNAAMDCFGYIDNYRMCGIILQGGVFFPFYLGLSGREHVQAEGSNVAKVTGGGVTGNGATDVVITLDRASPNLYVGQPIFLCPPDSAVPNSVDQANSSLESVTISAVNSPTEIEATLSANTFPDGTIVGWDAIPLAIMGNGPTATTTIIASKTVYMSHELDGTRTSSPIGVVYTPEIELSNETVVDPDGQPSGGFYQGRPVILEKTTAPAGHRKNMEGMPAFPVGAQVDQDIMRIGDPANAPAGDFRIFVSQEVEGGYSVSYGPGANPP